MRKENLEKLWNQATPSDIFKGSSWYNSVHNWTKVVALNYGIEHFKVVGILSCLSPRNQWDRNKQDLINFLEHGLDSKFGTFGNQVVKCLYIYNSENIQEVESILNGLKTIAFFRNIYDRSLQDVTVDVWIIRALEIEGSLTPKKYKEVEKVIQEFSRDKNIIPSDLQAIIWETIRNKSIETDKKFSNLKQYKQAA